MKHFVTGLCGAGKTTERLIPTVVKQIKERKLVCISVLSTDLQEQIAKDLASHGIESVVINTDTVDSVVNHLQLVFGPLGHDTSKALIITHAAYYLASGTLDTSGWYFHWDEMPSDSSKTVYQKNLNHKTAKKLDHTSLIDVNPDTKLCTLKKGYTSKTQLGTYCDALKHICALIYSGNVDVYLDSDNEKYASFITIYKPDFFPENTTFYGANIEHNPFYHIFKYYDSSVTIEILPSKNKNHDSNKINIYSSTSVNNTKYLQETYPEQFDKIVRPLVEHIGDKPCLLLKNKSSNVQLKDNFKQVSHAVHGLNNLSNYHNVLLLSALNPSDSYIQVVSKYGIDYEHVMVARTLETYYQVSARTAVRRCDELTEEVNIYVINHNVAEALKQYVFPNANLIRLADIEIDTPRVGGRKLAETIGGKDRQKLVYMRKLAKADESYYPAHVRKGLLTMTGKDAIQLTKMPWWNEYNSRGKKKK